MGFEDNVLVADTGVYGQIGVTVFSCVTEQPVSSQSTDW